MMFSQINPFIYGKNNTPDIRSSILRSLIKVCAFGRAKRSLTNESAHISDIPGNVSMTLTAGSLPELTYMNITPNGTIGMIYHTLNVSANPKSLEISLKPAIDNETFDLYIRKQKMPNLNTYDWRVTLPKNLTNENESYTFFIPGGNVTPGLLYVGVRKTPGKFLLLSSGTY